MIYRPLGRTGLQVSALSYGASPLGSVFRPIEEAEGIRTVHTALDLGINFIDVSPYYGLTRAEAVLGRALATVPRDRYILATKVGRYGESEFDFSAERVTHSIEESLGRLGIETIDLIQCHDVEFGDLNQAVEETIPALERARDAGNVRFIGITGYPLRIFPDVLERRPLDTILTYCRYTLNDRSLAALIPFLEAKGVGIINASPLAMRLLTDRGAPEWHPAPAALKAACAQAAAWGRERGTDLARLALQFALAEPRIATTLVGTADPDHLRRNVAWIASPPDPDLLAGVEAILAPVLGMTWPVGRPENQ
jgi:L-galactose dehydrogenase